MRELIKPMMLQLPAIQTMALILHVSLSTTNFTNEDINGFSTFCCGASNDIGMTTSCLNFTETGTCIPISKTLFCNTVG